MKLILLLLAFCLSSPCFSCTDEAKEKLKVFARILENNESDLWLAIFYPNEIQNESLSHVTFSYYRGKEFIMLVDAKISDNTYGFSNINSNEYSSSSVALNPNELNNIAISIHYANPPGPDGVVKACDHVEHFKLNEIIENK